MFFLCNRYKQFQDLEAISTGIVSDYHIYKNKIFANNTLTPSEFNKFSRIYDILTEDLEMPNVIIFLDADLEILKSVSRYVIVASNIRLKTTTYLI